MAVPNNKQMHAGAHAARRTGILLIVDLLESVVFLIQGHAPHAQDAIATEITSPQWILRACRCLLATRFACVQNHPPVFSDCEHSRPEIEAREALRIR